MGVIATCGISKSVAVVATITIIKIDALIYAVIVADTNMTQIIHNWHNFLLPFDMAIWAGIFSGAFLAFYAFIGFENMVNLAEEVKDDSTP